MNNKSFEENWKEIEICLKKIDNFCENIASGHHNPEIYKTLFKPKELMTTYTCIYNMCSLTTPNYSADVYKKYEMLNKVYLSKVSQRTASVSDHELLNEIVKSWQHFCDYRKHLFKFFFYLDKFYVIHNHKPTLEALSASNFSVIVLGIESGTRQKFFQSFINEMNKAKDDEIYNPLLLKDASQMMLNLEKRLLSDFSNMLLDTVKKDYQQTLNTLLLENTETVLIKVEAMWKKEKSICEKIFSLQYQNTLKELEKIFLQEIVKPLKTKVCNPDDGLSWMIVNERYQALKTIYDIFKMLDDYFEIIRQEFRKFITNEITKYLNENSAEIKSKVLKKMLEQSKHLLELFMKFLKVVKEVFQNDSVFVLEINNGFEAALKNTSLGHVISQILAQYSSSILCKGSQYSDAKIDEELEKVIRVYACLSEKDYFLKTYESLLADRLLGNTSESMEFEKKMISKIKVSSGSEATIKLEGMIQDINKAQEFSDKFLVKHEDLKEKFLINVLTQSYWPSAHAINFLEEMQDLSMKFSEFFFNETNKTRKIVFHSVSGVVVLTFKAVKAIFLELKPDQASILLTFNMSQIQTVDKIMACLNIKDAQIAKSLLESLSKDSMPILLKEGTDTYRVNLKFTSKMRKVKVPYIQLESKEQTENLFQDRSLAVDAAIVKLMKARKTLFFKEIIQNVAILLNKFSPDQKLIRMRIDRLIDQDILERDHQDSNIIHYKA